MKLSEPSGLFGTPTRTNILLALVLMEETHAAELARILGRSLSTVQNAIEKLEQVGAVAGVAEGKTRRIRLDPRYFARDELRSLLEKLAPSNKELTSRITALRRRPRRSGKRL